MNAYHITWADRQKAQKKAEAKEIINDIFGGILLTLFLIEVLAAMMLLQ